MGTQFTVFDNGDAPKGRSAQNSENLRKELCAVNYVSAAAIFYAAIGPLSATYSHPPT